MTVTAVRKDADTLTMTLDAEFDASPERVWQLWADPRQLERWWGPPTYPATVTSHHLRPGGRVEYHMTGPDGDQPRGYWEIVQVDAPHRLIFSDGFANADGTPNSDIPLNKIQVTMTKPYRREARVKEPRFPWQRYYDEVVVGYNAYSPKGDVTGEVVYANYGLPADYEALEELGVDVRGKIVMVRYGESFRGVKAKVAEDLGAKGVIIYSDPEDDGFVKGPVFPDGPWKDANGIQRGSIEYIFQYPGDPLTPGAPSIPGTPRLDPADATNLPRIPTTPLSYGEAKPMLEALTGPEAPEEFQGGLPFKYHVGPGPTETRLNLDIAYEQERVNNVVV